MNLLEASIKTYYGTEYISLNKTYDEILALLNNNNVSFQVEIYNNKGGSHDDEWKVIRIEGDIDAYFVRNKMFKVDFGKLYKGKLENGIFIGMPMEEALLIDQSLKYDEWEENFSSEQGYWIEDDLESNTVTHITVFIKEVLDDNLFYTYEWTK